MNRESDPLHGWHYTMHRCAGRMLPVSLSKATLPCADNVILLNGACGLTLCDWSQRLATLSTFTSIGSVPMLEKFKYSRQDLGRGEISQTESQPCVVHCCCELRLPAVVTSAAGSSLIVLCWVDVVRLMLRGRSVGRRWISLSLKRKVYLSE